VDLPSSRLKVVSVAAGARIAAEGHIFGLVSDEQPRARQRSGPAQQAGARCGICGSSERLVRAVAERLRVGILASRRKDGLRVLALYSNGVNSLPLCCRRRRAGAGSARGAPPIGLSRFDPVEKGAFCAITGEAIALPLLDFVSGRQH